MRYVLRLLVVCVLACAAGCTSSATTPPPTTAARSALPFSITRLTESFSATAAEVIAVRGYTYVRAVLDDGSERWIASLPRTIHVGARLDIRTFGSSSSFESRQLQRTFPTLWFGVLSPSAAPSPAPSPTTSTTTAQPTEST